MEFIDGFTETFNSRGFGFACAYVIIASCLLLGIALVSKFMSKHFQQKKK